MKRKIFTGMLICSLILSSVGCGSKKAEQPAEINDDITQEVIQEESDDEDLGQPEAGSMTREEVIEKYMKPMQALKSEFDDCNEPDKIVSLAKEHGVLAVEGFYAYKNSVGSNPEIDILPRRMYLAKRAFYNGLQEMLPEYNEMYLSYNEEGCNEEALDPEASDVVILLCKTDSVNDCKVITDFCLMYDGGDTVIKGAVSDYTDANIGEITVYNDRIEFVEVGFKSYTFFNRNGSSLDYDTTYYDFDTNIEREDYGYTFDSAYWSPNLEADEDFLLNVMLILDYKTRQ